MMGEECLAALGVADAGMYGRCVGFCGLREGGTREQRMHKGSWRMVAGVCAAVVMALVWTGAGAGAVPPVGPVTDAGVQAKIARAKEAGAKHAGMTLEAMKQRGAAVEGVISAADIGKMDAASIYGVYIGTDMQFSDRLIEAVFDRLELLSADDGVEGVKAAGVLVELSRTSVPMERERNWVGRLLRHPKASVYFGGKAGLNTIPDWGKLRRGALEPWLKEMAGLPKYWGSQEGAVVPLLEMTKLYTAFVQLAGDGMETEREKLRVGLERVAKETIAKVKAPYPEGSGLKEESAPVRWLRQAEGLFGGPALKGELYKVGARAPGIEFEWAGGGGGAKLEKLPRSLGELKGRVVVVVWFKPGAISDSRTRKALDELQAKYADRGLVVVGLAASEGWWGPFRGEVEAGDGARAAEFLGKYVAEEKPKFVVAYAGRGDRAAEFGASFLLPRMQVLGADGGVIRMPGSGGMAADRVRDVEAVVAKVLGGDGGGGGGEGK